MKFQITKKGLNDCGKVYEGEVVARYINGFKIKVMFGDAEDTAFVQYSDMKILEATPQELEYPINW